MYVKSLRVGQGIVVGDDILLRLESAGVARARILVRCRAKMSVRLDRKKHKPLHSSRLQDPERFTNFVIAREEREKFWIDRVVTGFVKKTRDGRIDLGLSASEDLAIVRMELLEVTHAAHSNGLLDFS